MSSSSASTKSVHPSRSVVCRVVVVVVVVLRQRLHGVSSVLSASGDYDAPVTTKQPLSAAVSGVCQSAFQWCGKIQHPHHGEATQEMMMLVLVLHCRVCQRDDDSVVYLTAQFPVPPAAPPGHQLSFFYACSAPPPPPSPVTSSPAIHNNDVSSFPSLCCCVLPSNDMVIPWRLRLLVLLLAASGRRATDSPRGIIIHEEYSF